MSNSKSLLLVFLISFFYFSAFADCGLQGDLETRISACDKKYKDLQLVMEKHGREFWFSPQTKSIFQVVNAYGWQSAKSKCQELKQELSFQNIKYDWSLSVSGEIIIAVTEVYPQLNIRSNGEEQRYWLGNTFNHPTGKKWASFYSTKGYIDKWFLDAGDEWYVGGICSVVLN